MNANMSRSVVATDAANPLVIPWETPKDMISGLSDKAVVAACLRKLQGYKFDSGHTASRHFLKHCFTTRFYNVLIPIP
jgi:hypothetical protein